MSIGVRISDVIGVLNIGVRESDVIGVLNIGASMELSPFDKFDTIMFID